MQEGMIETKNGKIWFAAYGEGLKKTPILVLHGGPGFLSMSDGLKSLWEDVPYIFTINWAAAKVIGRQATIFIPWKTISPNWRTYVRP